MSSKTQPAESPRGHSGTAQRLGDVIFSRSAMFAGSMIMVTLAAVAIFLIARSVPAFFADKQSASILTTNFFDYVLPLIFGTVWAAALALLFAFPLAVGIALFISHYAPRRLASVLGYIVDLLAAVPSVVFGLWGITVLAPTLQPVFAWINSALGSAPGLNLFFGGAASGTGRTILTAALVLGVMILPIMTAICREIFLQAPRLHEEAALALGATRWEMIRMAVLPFGRSGMVSAAMLGLGRALGETMAVAMVLSATGAVSLQLLTSENPSTIAANIALSFPEAYGTNINVLIATGLILFIVTFLVNAIARWIVNRRAEFSGAN
ncbi:phosphate ABC transporter permease subunit PstC [Leucobacter sp. OH2974_COT-288]|uniref:Phosphate transport system permease protein n=1 Tax=Canibacter oris TaxID=1365628 RepID=A0A840DPY1_9MICO|nr:phosphate transport system permease protein [Canibacter oris]RRD36659.1 phosphate ABC transporter permease subunit PstC [Leucobacter sp. OH2974_COT-288]